MGKEKQREPVYIRQDVTTGGVTGLPGLALWDRIFDAPFFFDGFFTVPLSSPIQNILSLEVSVEIDGTEIDFPRVLGSRVLTGNATNFLKIKRDVKRDSRLRIMTFWFTNPASMPDGVFATVVRGWFV